MPTMTSVFGDSIFKILFSLMSSTKHSLDAVEFCQTTFISICKYYLLLIWAMPGVFAINKGSLSILYKRQVVFSAFAFPNIYIYMEYDGRNNLGSVVSFHLAC